MEPAPDYLVGELISDCKILEKVGEGGFGSVYKALDQNLQRTVAFKVMLRSLSSNAEFVQKFLREAVTAAKLNHPNIVSIHKVGRDERRGIHYLIMEFVEGQTLAEIVKAKGVLGVEECIGIMLQSADALATAHEHNIVHRDIKPDNLMLAKSGKVKITDFGLAKSLTGESHTTKVMGTPHYMSPEQFEGKPVDGRSDIYSLGVTFYYLLSKARPYEGENTVQIIYSILTQDPKPLPGLNDKVSEKLWGVIQKMIAKTAEERYQTLRETIHDLRGFQDQSAPTRMSCPSCNARNPRGRKFCRACGAPLLVRCPSCGNLDPVGTHACSNCEADIELLTKVKKALDSGERFKTLGDLRRAAEAYKRVLELDPEHAEAKVELAELGETLDEVDRVRTQAEDLARTGEIQTALQRVEDLLKRYPTAQEVREHRDALKADLGGRQATTLADEAERAVLDGDLRLAIDLLDQAHRFDATNENIKDRRSELREQVETVKTKRRQAAEAMAAGRYADAFTLASEVLRLDPDDRAMQDVRSKAQQSVESVDEFVSRGRAKLEANELTDALADFEAAHSLHPGDSEVFQLVESTRHRLVKRRERISLCRRLMAERKFAQAMEGLNEALADSPDNSEVKRLLKECERGLTESKRHAEIDTSLKQAQRLSEAGDFNGALEKYQKVLEFDARNPVARAGRDDAEGKIREERDIGELASEHLKKGGYQDAIAAFQRLKQVNPARAAEVDREIAEARTRESQVQGSVQRAEQALMKREFRRAQQAAKEVLDLAPSHPGAVAIKKDATKAVNAIDRFLAECDRMILSELFDEALDALDKAKERGAVGEEYKSRWQQCQEGRLALLKADATRSLVINNFEAAIAAYDQVLELAGADSDALTGKRSAERRLRILTTEPLSLRLGAAAVVMLLLGLVNFSAAAYTQTGEAGGTTEISDDEKLTGGGGTAEVIADQDPDPEPALAAEAKNDHLAASRLWAEEIAKFPQHQDADELRAGQEYNDRMLRALDASTSFEARLDALPAEGDLGDFPARKASRRAQVDRVKNEIVDAWFREAERTEAVNAKKAIEDFYNKILVHPVASRSDQARSTVTAVVNHLTDINVGEQALDQGLFEDAAETFLDARDAMERTGDEKRAAEAQKRVDGVREAWVGDLRRKHVADPSDEDEWYGEVAESLQRLGAVLRLSRDELARVVEQVRGR